MLWMTSADFRVSIFRTAFELTRSRGGRYAWMMPAAVFKTL